MENRTWLQIPGPTNIPARILARLAEPMINHRGPRFARLLADCALGLQRVLRTAGDVLLFPSSGTGMLESAIVNLFSPGDTIVAASMGVFSERMAAIAEAHRLRVVRIAKRWGSAVEPDDVVKILADDPARRIAAVCLPHAETSTGVTNDLAAIRAGARRTGHPALFIVDAVSSLACLPLETDAWGLDVVLSASQKGLMLPPGMGIAAVSKAAWGRIGASTMPRWYWDYRRVRDSMAGGQLPYTPPTALLVGLEESLRMIEEETLEGVWKRHAAVALAVRGTVRDMGLGVLPDERHASDVLTAVNLPEGIVDSDLASRLRAGYSVEIGGGLGELKGRIFRIGHMGSISILDAFTVMGAVAAALRDLGAAVPPSLAVPGGPARL